MKVWGIKYIPEKCLTSQGTSLRIRDEYGPSCLFFSLSSKHTNICCYNIHYLQRSLALHILLHLLKDSSIFTVYELS